MYNMHWEPHEFGPPRPPKGRRWHVAVDTSLSQINGYYPPGEEPVAQDQRRYLVNGRSVVVLIGKAHEAEKEETPCQEKNVGLIK